jgi:hypothetical protein
VLDPRGEARELVTFAERAAERALPLILAGFGKLGDAVL